MIDPEEVIEIMEHWRKVRETRLKDDEGLYNENLRCAIDLVGLLGEHGIYVEKRLWLSGRKRTGYYDATK